MLRLPLKGVFEGRCHRKRRWHPRTGNNDPLGLRFYAATQPRNQRKPITLLDLTILNASDLIPQGRSEINHFGNAVNIADIDRAMDLTVLAIDPPGQKAAPTGAVWDPQK